MALGDILAAKLAPIIGGTVLGGDVTIRFVSGGTYNATTGSVTETESDTDTNELIQAGDKKLLISAEDVTSAPETKDRVVINSIVYQIIQVDKEELNCVDIAYTLYLRA